jgi:hypothetical protein
VSRRHPLDKLGAGSAGGREQGQDALATLKITTKNPRMKQVYLAEIELLALDVDGVLTDGTLIIHASGVRPSHTTCGQATCGQATAIRKSAKRTTKANLLPFVRSWVTELRLDFTKRGSKL